MTSDLSGPPYGGLFDALPGDPVVDRLIDDRAFVDAVLSFEVALAAAQHRHGLIPTESLVEILNAGANDQPDLAALSTTAADTGNPVVAIVRDLGRGAGEAAGWVHHGATSQDALDTAFAVLTARVAEHLLETLGQTGTALAALAEQHIATPMTGRTLGRPAATTTFGLTVCGWLDGLRAARRELQVVRDEVLAVQLGGAVGTLAGIGDVTDDVAAALGLQAPALPWHTERSRILRAASALTQTINAAGKVAVDVLGLSVPEVGEVTLGADPDQAERGGSSALPHKRNPVSAVLINAAATQAPGLLATIAASGVHQHQRADGAWHAEWRPLRELLHLAGGAARELDRLVGDLQVDPAAMRRNLTAGGGVLQAEGAVLLLAPHLGRTAAHALVQRATRAVADGRMLADVLSSDPGAVAAVGVEAIRAALDPADAAGAAIRLATSYLDSLEDP